jgi:tRNA(fMet)-specific endonuclease VapC
VTLPTGRVVKWLLDTDTVIYDMKEIPIVVGRLEATRPTDRFLSLITVGELFFGIFRSAQVERNLRRYRRFFARVKLLPFIPAVAERFGTVKAELARRGEMVADHDLWIAAHALVHGAMLVTDNDRDFGWIAGLRIENRTK